MLSPQIGHPIVILTSLIATVFLFTASALLTHSIDNFLSSLKEFVIETQNLIDEPTVDVYSLITGGDVNRGKAFLVLIWGATGATAITFLAGALEYKMLLSESSRQRKMAPYNSNPAVLPAEAHESPPEYASKSEGVQQEVGEVGSEAIALRELNVCDRVESPVSPITVGSRPGSQGLG